MLDSLSVMSLCHSQIMIVGFDVLYSFDQFSVKSLKFIIVS